PRPGAAPQGVRVQAGGDGAGRGGVGRPGRVRRLAESGFKRAATAQEGAGPGAPPGCGVSRGRGSSGRQGRGRGRWSCAAGWPGRGERGAGAPRPRRPGAGAGRPGITGNPPTWANTDSEGGGGGPADLGGAPGTGGRPAWGGWGLSGP